MVREKVHSGKDSNNVPVSRQKFSNLPLPGTVDGSDGSLISESFSSGDSSITVDGSDGSSISDSSISDFDEKQIEGQNSDQASATNDNIKPVLFQAKPVEHAYSIRFQLFWPFRFVKLKQEVDKRLLKEGDERLRGDYTIPYEDRRLISCDDDVQLCVNISRELGKTRVNLLLN